MTATGLSPMPALHVPDEPTVHKLVWRDRVLGGEDLETLVTGPGGPGEWLWGRWRVLATAGMGRAELEAVVGDYRREIWLWLAGERTWEQCCSGLIGRISRRLAAPS